MIQFDVQGLIQSFQQHNERAYTSFSSIEHCDSTYALSVSWTIHGICFQ